MSGYLQLPIANAGNFSGSWTAPDGTAAVPSYGFANEAMGMYRAGSGLLGFSAAGAVQATLSSSSVLTLNAGGAFGFSGRSQVQSPADGQWTLLNNAGTGFTRLNLGGTTSSFPSIKRNATAINFRLADDSADAGVTAAASTFSGTLTVSAGGLAITGNSTITGTLGGLTGLTVASGGATVTAGGLTVTAGGLTVSAGGAAITGNSTIAGTLGSLTGLTLASGVVTLPAGAVGAPSINLGSATTGPYAPASNQYAITTNGVQAILWDASQNTTIPSGSSIIWNTQVKLGSVTNGRAQLLKNDGSNGSARDIGLLLGSADANGVGLYRQANGQLGVYDGTGNSAAQATAFAWWVTNTDGSARYGTSDGNNGFVAHTGTTRVAFVANGQTVIAGDSSKNVNFTPTVAANGSNLSLQCATVSHTCNGAAATETVLAIPAGALVMGVVARVTTTITGCTTFDIGDGTTATKWGAGLAVASGTTASNASWKDASSPQVYNSSENIVLTAHGGGGTFTGGVIEVFIYYFAATAPTS